jgi:D-alanyl-D-alanine dipeptidase
VLLALALSLLRAPAIAAAPALPEGFTYLADVAPDVRQDLRYFGTHNFVGARVESYLAPRCILTRPAAEALRSVQAELAPLGLSLKVFDCYRPQAAVNHFMRWAADARQAQTRDAYYPRVTKQQLLDEVYVASKSGHSRGSTVDLTLVDVTSAPARNPAGGEDGCNAAAARRDGALDMGTGFDCFDPLAWTASTSVTPQQRANRLLLRTLMEKHGFQNYAREWWHYTLREEPFPDRYFDFPVR